MDALVDQDMSIVLQWVPGHADIAGNEAADRLANRAAVKCDQTEAPIDLASARTAIRQRAREMQAARARRHPHPEPTPGREDLPRWEQVTVSQLRTGYCPFTRATLHRLDLVSDPLCRECGAEDTVEHLLTECPAYASTRHRLWGTLPSISSCAGGVVPLVCGPAFCAVPRCMQVLIMVLGGGGVNDVSWLNRVDNGRHSTESLAG